jgi:hypothetical protein
MTPAEIRTLPATVDVATAGRALGIGRTKAYQLARDGEFPCRLLHLGCTYRVVTADLLTVLGLAPGTESAVGERTGQATGQAIGGGWSIQEEGP